jgi:carboxypeptidase T
MNHFPRCRYALTLILLVLLSLGHPAVVLADGGDVVTVSFGSRSELAQLAQRLDIWEVRYTTSSSGEGVAGTVVARITTADGAWLAAEGFDVRIAGASAVEPATIPAYPCYHTIDEMVAQLNTWAGAYPALTELYTAGNSYEGRPLYVLRLTNQATGLDKPVFFLMANIHGRELITSETALQFVKLMLEGYGIDPDVTWLLDHQRIEVMVSANPDGHVRNETSFTYWRKNANPTYGTCGGTSFGIDLNRNSSFQWGGASPEPCYETYQGPSAASETETQAIETLIQTLFPDQRLPALDAPAPDDATGIFITLHSYSNLVLWPWGHTTDLAPNADQLARLGRKLATYNGYFPEQAIGLYPTTGTTDDFAYGELGVASYTFEMGDSDDGFYPSCDRHDALIEPNLDALLYAAKVARTPYLTAAGPDALQVSAGVDLAATPPVITVTAQIDDQENGGQAVAGAEAYFDVLPWDGGVAHSLTATDGTFDAALESAGGTFTVTASSGGLATGRYLVFVRGMDADGAWGPFSAAFVRVWTSVYLPLVVRAP